MTSRKFGVKLDNKDVKNHIKDQQPLALTRIDTQQTLLSLAHYFL